MRISTRGRYALRLMLDIARYGDDKQPVSLSAVSERTGISHGYLEQLAPALRAGRLIRGVAGRHGGYKLAAPASKITIRQIIEASIGPISVVECVEDPDSCLRTDFCECRVVYALINQRVAGVLDEFTLADLVDPSWVREHKDVFDLQLAPLGVAPVRS
ncbi:MAG: Rrf2 family transcriptional regulator [Candidatus Aminicenantes bacterium]|nr:MAG: Rrf2 family transcriptional regulator [Candidatus Aminicenantes bacterium]